MGRRSVLSAALAAALGFGACALLHAQERVAVVTTTSDLRSLAEAVGGERVAVTSLVPPGFDPEEYQPRPQDIARIAKARVVARVGLDFDLWFDRLLMQAGPGVRRGAEGYVDASYAISTLDVRGVSVAPATATRTATAIRIIGSIPRTPR